MPVAFLRWSRSRPLCNGGSGGVSCLVASPASRPSSLSEPHQVVGQYLRQLLAIAYRGGLKGGLLSACVGRPKSARLRPSARARLTRGVVHLGTAGKEAAWTSLVNPPPLFLAPRPPPHPPPVSSVPPHLLTLPPPECTAHLVCHRQSPLHLPTPPRPSAARPQSRYLVLTVTCFVALLPPLLPFLSPLPGPWSAARRHVNARTARSGVSTDASPAMGRRKSSTAAFPPSRIKKMMQADDDVGKVATATPVLVRLWCEGGGGLLFLPMPLAVLERVCMEFWGWARVCSSSS